MWFQFFSSDEDKALQQWEASVLSTPADTASTPESQKLPEALKWVREHYDPHQRAAELLADRGRSASVLSNASALRSPGMESYLVLFSHLFGICDPRSHL